MSVQLGGGTDIGGAVGYCAQLIQMPPDDGGAGDRLL